MVRNFLHGKKISPNANHETEENLELLRIGSNQHFLRDKRFHNSAYFKETSQTITQILRPKFIEANIPRDWFAAHVLTEMMIDRVLIRETPKLADGFYQDTTNADSSSIADFLQERNITETHLFLERLARFNQAKYLLQYAHNRAMVYSMNRIFMQTKADGEWSQVQFQILEPVIEEVDFVITSNIINLKNEMA